MRVLQVIPDMSISNGAMSMIMNYQRAMSADVQFDYLYFLDTQADRRAEIEALGGHVYKMDFPKPKDVLPTKKMRAFFLEHKETWQAMHIHGPHFAVFVAPAAKMAGLRNIVVHSHTTVYTLIGSAFANRLLSQYAKYCIPKKLACSRASGQLWYGQKPFTELRNAVDCRALQFDPAVREHMRWQLHLDDAFVVGHIGKTDIPQKNHEFLFSVFAEIHKLRSNAKLLLIGAVPTDRLTALAKELNIVDSVLFLGPQSQISAYLQAMDLFVFPSISEGLPMSVVEAQAAGLPVVLSDAVTREVACTPLVKTLSLHQSPEEWAGAALQPQPPRQSPTAALIAGGWNIRECAVLLEKIYRE